MKYSIVLLYCFFYMTSQCQVKYDLRIEGAGNNHRYYLEDKRRHFKSETFSDFSVEDKYIFCYDKGLIKVFTKDDGKLLIKDARAVMRISNFHLFYQFLINNDIIWLVDRQVVKLNPNEKGYRFGCGNVTRFSSEILQSKDSSFLRLKGYRQNEDTSYYCLLYDLYPFVNENKITFLNAAKLLDYSENNSFRTNLDENTFMLKKANNKIDIVRFDFDSNQVRFKILIKEVDTIYNDTIQADLNTFPPFIYKKNNLYGYFPYSLKERYILLKPFDGAFARFILPNKKKGWLDRNGKEYLGQ